MKTIFLALISILVIFPSIVGATTSDEAIIQAILESPEGTPLRSSSPIASCGSKDGFGSLKNIRCALLKQRFFLTARCERI